MDAKRIVSLIIMIIFLAVLSSYAVALGNEPTHSSLELPVSLYSGANSVVLCNGDLADVDFELI